MRDRMTFILAVTVGIMIDSIKLLIQVPIIILVGWFIGHIVKFFCGDFIVTGLNILVGVERFTVEMLPTICGVLALFGSFFRSSKSSSKE